MLLVPIVLLKLASTGYRFLRYYSHRPRVRGRRSAADRAPPARADRRAGHGRALRDGRRTWRARAWARPSCCAAQGELRRLGRRDVVPRARARARAARRSRRATCGGGRWAAAARADVLLAGAIVAGAMVAVATLPWIGPWVHCDAVRRLSCRCVPARAAHNEAMRVLVVEDEAKLGQLLVRGLDEEGHAADVAGDGEEALWMAARGAVRRDRPRRDAAGPRRLRRLPPRCAATASGAPS